MSDGGRPEDGQPVVISREALARSSAGRRSGCA